MLRSLFVEPSTLNHVTNMLQAYVHKNVDKLHGSKWTLTPHTTATQKLIRFSVLFMSTFVGIYFWTMIINRDVVNINPQSTTVPIRTGLYISYGMNSRSCQLSHSSWYREPKMFFFVVSRYSKYVNKTSSNHNCQILKIKCRNRVCTWMSNLTDFVKKKLRMYLDSLHSVQSWLWKEPVITMQCQRVPNEVNCVVINSIFAATIHNIQSCQPPIWAANSSQEKTHNSATTN